MNGKPLLSVESFRAGCTIKAKFYFDEELH